MAHQVPARYTKEALEDDTIYGAAMKALNPRQRGFVLALYELGDRPAHSDCARAAGYEGDDNYLRVQGHRLSHHPKVLAAIREEADRRALGLLPLAHRRMEGMLLDPNHKDHATMVKHTQALSGQSPKQIHVVEHIHDRKEILDGIKGLLLQMRGLGINIDDRAMTPIDVEFNDVTPTALPAPSSQGIEDLL